MYIITARNEGIEKLKELVASEKNDGNSLLLLPTDIDNSERFECIIVRASNKDMLELSRMGRVYYATNHDHCYFVMVGEKLSHWGRDCFYVKKDKARDRVIFSALTDEAFNLAIEHSGGRNRELRVVWAGSYEDEVEGDDMTMIDNMTFKGLSEIGRLLDWNMEIVKPVFEKLVSGMGFEGARVKEMSEYLIKESILY